MSPIPKLTYFDARAVAEPIRFVLKYAGIEFEDERFAREEFPQIKAKMPFGQMPILTLQNGKVYHQSLAILRYFAKQTKLAGNDAIEDMEIEAIVDTLRSDLKHKFEVYYWEQDPKEKEIKRKELFNERLPFFLDRLEKIAQENQGHLACKRLTYADLHWAADIDFFYAISGNEKLFEKYPNLMKVAENVRELPAIKKWISERPRTFL